MKNDLDAVLRFIIGCTLALTLTGIMGDRKSVV
jgi:hypothetical protein